MLEEACQPGVVDLHRLEPELCLELGRLSLTLAERARRTRAVELRAAPLETEPRHDGRRPRLRRSRHARIERVRNVQTPLVVAAKLFEPLVGEGPAAVRVLYRSVNQYFATGAALESFRICVARRRRVDDEPAADRRPRAQHDAVAARSHDRRVEPELGESVDPHDAREHRRGAVVDEHARRDRRELLDLDVEPVADVVRIGLDEGVASAELSPLDAGKGNCDALPGFARRRLRDRGPGRCERAPRGPPGPRGARLPAAILPDQRVPVATVPMPCRLNTRST